MFSVVSRTLLQRGEGEMGDHRGGNNAAMVAAMLQQGHGRPSSGSPPSLGQLPPSPPTFMTEVRNIGCVQILVMLSPLKYGKIVKSIYTIKQLKYLHINF